MLRICLSTIMATVMPYAMPAKGTSPKADGAASPAASATAIPYDVKGIALGSSFADLRARFGEELSCGQPAEGFIDHRLPTSQRFCHLKGPSETFFRKMETFAGQSTSISYWIIDDKVGLIKFSDIRPEKFDEIVATMSSKYGTPNVATSPIQNRMGATFEQKIATWDSYDVIRYRRYREQLDYSSELTFYSREVWNLIEHESAAQSEAAKNDM